MKPIKVLITLLSLCSYIVLNGQGVGIGIQNPTAKLHIHESDFFTGIGANLRLSNFSSGNTANDGMLIYYHLGKSGIDLKENHLFSIATNGIDRFNITNDGRIGIGTENPESSILLQLDSDSLGFLLPRMNNTRLVNIPSPPNGMMTYNTTNNWISIYNQNKWQHLDPDQWQTISLQEIWTKKNVFISDSQTSGLESRLFVGAKSRYGIRTILQNIEQGESIGIESEIKSSATGDKFGIRSFVTGNTIEDQSILVGLYGFVERNLTQGPVYGVIGEVSAGDGGGNENENYGVYGRAFGEGYGIYAEGTGNADAALLDGRTTIVGPENDGNMGALEIHSGFDRLYLDGDEIDAMNGSLYLNNNSGETIILANGGGNVAIGTENISSGEKLKVNGKTVTESIVTSDLQGGGKRNIIVDDNGEIIIDNKEYVYTVNAYDFISTENNPDFFVSGIYGAGIDELISQGEGVIRAPIHLPNDAIIHSVVIYYRDHERLFDYNLSIRMIEDDVSTTESSILIDFMSSGQDENIRVKTFDNVNHIVDNENKMYSIQMFEADSSRNWKGGTVKAVVFKYTLN